MFTGCGTALVTPFRTDGSVDEQTLRALVRRQIEEGINFLVPCGTTGENPTLSREEHLRVVEITVEEANASRAGAGRSRRLQHRRSDRVGERGARGWARTASSASRRITTSPLRKASTSISKRSPRRSKLPIILYNIQGRSGVNIETATLKRLAEIDNIVGVKEASGNIGADGAL